VPAYSESPRGRSGHVPS